MIRKWTQILVFTTSICRQLACSQIQQHWAAKFNNKAFMTGGLAKMEPCIQINKIELWVSG